MFRYLVTANCKSATITFAKIGSPNDRSSFRFSKETAALVIVCGDLLIALALWLSFLGMKTFHKMVDNDINMGTLKTTDFSVVMEQEPHKDHINDFKGVMWAWAEEILDNEPDQSYMDPVTDMLDNNQNKLFNINMGLSNLEYLGVEEKMGRLLVQKKKLDKKKMNKKLSTGEKAKLGQEIKKKQNEAKKLLEKIKVLKQKRRGRAIYSYL